MRFTRLLIAGVIIGLVGCKADQLEVDESQSNITSTKGAAASLSQQEFESLTPEQQYQVANKLAATLYKGVPVEDFFDLSHGVDSLKVTGGKNFLSDTKQKLKNKIFDITLYQNAVKSRHTFSSDTQEITAEPLATIMEFPISRDMFEAWMAYTLTNTILFSPAEEIDSADQIDVQRVYDGLVRAMSEDATIREIILTHEKSQANWRRFRSPEDNTREMIEIYLGLFDRDADVPKASIACKNWSLTDDDQGYQLIVDNSSANTEPQQVLGQWITSCEDFYELIAGHPLVIPRITTYLVDRFFPDETSEKRAAIVQDIVATDPQRFHDIFLPIIFSREYLLNNQRAKSFEESFFNLAGRTNWISKSGFLNQLVFAEEGKTPAFPTLDKMGQPAMRLKLGRFKNQPLDSLSFATYHQAIRDKMLALNDDNWGYWNSSFIANGDYFELDDYITYLFLSTAARRPSDNELQTLYDLIEANEITDKKYQAKIVLDYVSRLPEIYFYNAIN